MVTVRSVTLWMLLAMLAGLITYTLWRRGGMRASVALILPILVFYLSFVLTITLFERTAVGEPRYELELFWSYKAIAAGTTKLAAENFWNVVLFVPIGVLFSLLLKKRLWLSVLLGALLSAGIEVAQLVTHRGLFEWDDMIHNSLGALIGWLLFLPLRKQGRREDV